jgi:hypothetical protein
VPEAAVVAVLKPGSSGVWALAECKHGCSCAMSTASRTKVVFVSILRTDVVEQKQIQEERDSAEQCLNICAQVCTHIDQAQLSKVFKDVSTPPDNRWARLGTPSSHASARLLTTESLKVCVKITDNSSNWLKGHLQNLDNRLASLPAQSPQISSEQAAEQERIQEEIDSIKQCLTIMCRSLCTSGPRPNHRLRRCLHGR